MTLQYLPYIAALIVATMTAALVAIYAWQRRATPGGIYFGLMMVMAAEWSFAYVGILAFAEIPAKILWSKLAYPAVVSLPPLWLLFALHYGHYTRWITPRRMALLWVVPVGVLVLTLTNEWHGLIWPQITPVAEFPGAIFDHGIGVWIDVVYSYALLLVGTILFVQTTLRSDPLYRQQIGALLVGAAIPWAANALYIMGVTPLRGMDATPVAFTLTGLIFAWSIFRFHTLDIVPIARDALIENMSDAVLVLDTHNRVVDINPAARQLTGSQPGNVIGQQAETLLSRWPDFMASHRNILEGEVEITLEAGDAFRWFDVRISPLYDRRRQLSGRLIVVRDITAHKQAEHFIRIQRDLGTALSSTSDLAEALNRVLEAVCRIESIDCGGVYLVDQQSGTSNLAAHRGLSAPFVSQVAQYEKDTPEAREISAGQPVYRGYAALRSISNAILEGEGLRALAVIPVLHEGQVIAALNLASHTQDDIPGNARAALEAIAVQIGDTLARIRAETAMQESQRNWQALFDTLDDFLFILDANGHIVKTNPVVQRRLGYTAEELDHMTMLDMHPPERREEAAAIVANMLAGREIFCPVPLLIKGGQTIPVETRIIRGKWGDQNVLFGISRDVTERERVGEALRHSEAAAQEQRRLAEALRDTITALSSTLDLEAVMNCILDNLGRVVSHDAASITLIEGDTARFAYWRGYGPDTEAFFRQHRLPADSFVHEVARTGIPRLAVNADNELAWVKSAALTWVHSFVNVPIRVGERIIGALNIDSATPGFFTTTHVELLQTFANQAAIAIGNAQLHAQIKRHAEELEQRVAERTAELTEANTRLLELDQLKSRFINDMSHELRTPITSIGMGLYLLKHDKLERMSAHLEQLESQFNRLRDLLEQTLNFARLHQAGPRSEPSVPIDLNDTVGSVVSTCSARAQAAGLALTFSPCPDPLTVRGHFDELTQAISHLVVNAIMYTPKGQVTVRTYREAEYACLEIQDTGIGIPSSDLPHLFTAFYRGKQVGSSNIPGMGLGLSIVKEILDRHHSQIIVRSEVGIGTTLTVRLPLD